MKYDLRISEAQRAMMSACLRESYRSLSIAERCMEQGEELQALIDMLDVMPAAEAAHAEPVTHDFTL